MSARFARDMASACGLSIIGSSVALSRRHNRKQMRHMRSKSTTMLINGCENGSRIRAISTRHPQRKLCEVHYAWRVGIPSGRSLPSPFGISTRLTACGWYVPSRKLVDSSDRYSSALAANRSTLCPSTPAAPLFASTFAQASASVADACILSINEYHLPPVTPFSSADSMRSVHTSASTHAQLLLARGVSAPCLASSALPVLVCSGMVFTLPPSYPAFPRRGFASPSSSRPCSGPQRYYAGSDSSPGRTPRQGLSACFVLPSEHPDPNHVVGPDITISSTSVCPAGCRHPDFALGPRARRTKTPKRVRYPTGCSFASGCSPPRLPRSRSRTTQLPSATCGVTSHGSDLHLLTKQHHRRTVPAFARPSPGRRRSRRLPASLVLHPRKAHASAVRHAGGDESGGEA